MPIKHGAEDGAHIREMFHAATPNPKQSGEPRPQRRNAKSPHRWPWTGLRGTMADDSDRAETDHRLSSFLTCEANSIIGSIHPKAIPVLRTTPEATQRGARDIDGERARAAARLTGCDAVDRGDGIAKRSF
ncbi:hypothetical protein ACLBWX_22110 [Methylobacterium sp. M6A4_1b]